MSRGGSVSTGVAATAVVWAWFASRPRDIDTRAVLALPVFPILSFLWNGVVLALTCHRRIGTGRIWGNAS